jgi:hypothetical protein
MTTTSVTTISAAGASISSTTAGISSNAASTQTYATGIVDYSNVPTGSAFGTTSAFSGVLGAAGSGVPGAPGSSVGTVSGAAGLGTTQSGPLYIDEPGTTPL